MGVKLVSSSGGSVEINSPVTASNFTQTLVPVTGTLAPLVSGTAVASTSGTSIDFTGIPSWVKRITVMFSGVSTNGSSNPLIQLGAGSVTNSGYVAQSSNTAATGGIAYTTGFGLSSGVSTNVVYGPMVFNLVGSNLWVSSFCGGLNSNGTPFTLMAGGSVTLSGTLDRVRITTVNGTDAFDAGSINILYE
jgi:hypothetical protein